MHQYTCPSCHSALKREAPVPAGKKIRCPNCETVFEPAPQRAAVRPVAVKAAGRPKDDEDEDGKNPYAVKDTAEDDEAMQAEKQRAAMGLVRDRFKKSKRGPAMKEVTRPANLLMASGVLLCILSVATVLVGGFPLIFQDFYNESSKPPPGMKYADWEAQKKAQGPKKMDAAEWNRQVLISCCIIGGGVTSFAWASCICVGAFKMRTLESYAWAWIGSVLCMMTFLFVVGIWCAMVLNNKLVKDGFAEEKPPEV